MKKPSATRKAKKIGKKAKPARGLKGGRTPKKIELRKPQARPAQVVLPPSRVEPPKRERDVMTVGSIRGDTAIGDLLVTFPRTREVLARKGLRLEADDAGDIYMTLEAFSAMNGLNTESLVRELVEVAKEPPLQQPVPQFATPTLA